MSATGIKALKLSIIIRFEGSKNQHIGFQPRQSY